MDVYLPIAELSLNVFAVLGLGAMVGIVTGVFGLGGGFLLTPMLIFIGVPAGVAYVYAVRAVDRAGNTSDSSSRVVETAR